MNCKLRFAATALLCGVVAPVLAAELPMAAPESVGVSPERLQRVADTMQRYIDEDLLAGTITLLARDGKVIHLESQGWRHREAGAEMTEDSIFVIMSMTKPIVSTALMMLYEEGRFLLTDPITDWIPELADKKVIVRDEFGTRRVPPVRPVSIRDVLADALAMRCARG